MNASRKIIKIGLANDREISMIPFIATLMRLKTRHDTTVIAERPSVDFAKKIFKIALDKSEESGIVVHAFERFGTQGHLAQRFFIDF